MFSVALKTISDWIHNAHSSAFLYMYTIASLAFQVAVMTQNVDNISETKSSQEETDCRHILSNRVA